MKLVDQRDHYKAKAEAYQAELNMILDYICMPKFFADNMVNTNDIALRIGEAKQRIIEEFGDL